MSLLPAATSTTAPTPTQAPISKLPRELLTKVFSHIPSEVDNIRLVCSGFHDCAWPAFGARVRNTTFDIRSIDSMKNLRSIAENVNLALYVTHLKLTAGFIAENFPHVQFTEDDEQIDTEDYMNEDLVRRTLEYRINKKSWFAEAWAWSPCMPHKAKGTLEEYATNSQIQLVVDFLVTTLTKFNNVHGVTYKEDRVPADFQDVLRDIIEAAEGKGADWEDFPSDDGSAMNILGLDIVLRALAKANVTVKELDIPIPAIYCRTIATFTSPAVVQKVLANVQSLRMQMSAKDDFIHHLKAQQELMLTSSTAPKLKSLRYDGCSDGLWPNQSPEPLTAYPPIQHLHLHELGIPLNDLFFSFLSGISHTLKTLTLSMNLSFDWVQLMQFLAKSPDISLERVVIVHDDFFKSTCFKGLAFPIKDAIYAAAKTVVFYPPDGAFNKWLEKQITAKESVA